MITTTTTRIVASRVLSRASATQIPLVFSHHFAPAPHCCPESMKMASTSTATSKSMPARTCIGNACRTFLTITDTNEEPTNPLTELKEMALAKNLCDQNGFRVPDKHWAFALSAHDISSHKPPKIKTVNFQRVSEKGIDFVSRKIQGSSSDTSTFTEKKPISFLYSEGKYQLGESIVQWRADGVCVKIDLKEVLKHVPKYTIAEMVATDRAKKESSSDRQSIPCAKSHFIEIVQKARMDLMQNNILVEEVDDCIQAWRFIPETMERMTGGPDAIVWDRVQFQKDAESSHWGGSVHLMPY